MPNLDDFDDPPFVVYRIHDAIGPLANAVTLGVPRKLLAAAGSRGLRETFDPGSDTGANRPGLHSLELFGRGRLDEEAIACHAAGEP